MHSIWVVILFYLTCTTIITRPARATTKADIEEGFKEVGSVLKTLSLEKPFSNEELYSLDLNAFAQKLAEGMLLEFPTEKYVYSDTVGAVLAFPITVISTKEATEQLKKGSAERLGLIRKALIQILSCDPVYGIATAKTILEIGETGDKFVYHLMVFLKGSAIMERLKELKENTNFGVDAIVAAFKHRAASISLGNPKAIDVPKRFTRQILMTKFDTSVDNSIIALYEMQNELKQTLDSWPRAKVPGNLSEKGRLAELLALRKGIEIHGNVTWVDRDTVYMNIFCTYVPIEHTAISIDYITQWKGNMEIPKLLNPMQPEASSTSCMKGGDSVDSEKKETLETEKGITQRSTVVGSANSAKQETNIGLDQVGADRRTPTAESANSIISNNAQLNVPHADGGNSSSAILDPSVSLSSSTSLVDPPAGDMRPRFALPNTTTVSLTSEADRGGLAAPNNSNNSTTIPSDVPVIQTVSPVSKTDDKHVTIADSRGETVDRTENAPEPVQPKPSSQTTNSFVPGTRNVPKGITVSPCMVPAKQTVVTPPQNGLTSLLPGGTIPEHESGQSTTNLTTTQDIGPTLKVPINKPSTLQDTEDTNTTGGANKLNEGNTSTTTPQDNGSPSTDPPPVCSSRITNGMHKFHCECWARGAPDQKSNSSGEKGTLPGCATTKR